MRNRYHTLLLLCATAALVLAGCDQSSQQASPENANRYIITQSSSAGDAATGSFSDANVVNVPDTVDYYMQGYTVDKDYTWTVNGSSDLPTSASSDQTYEWQSRGGEFITVVYGPGDPIATTAGMSASTNSIQVDASNDDINAETIDVSAAVTDSISGQIGRFGAFSTLTNLAASSGIAEFLGQEGPSFTLFAPSTAAFAADIDGDDEVEQAGAIGGTPTQAVDDDEDTDSSVRAQLLKYHAIQGDSLTASDLPVTRETVLGPEVTVNGDKVSQANIPATNGVIHKLNEPLFPPTALVDFTDRTLADTSVTDTDSLTVDGSYFPEAGGYIVLHEGSAGGPVVGSSEYVEGRGVSNDVQVYLNKDYSGESAVTLVAMPHEETTGDETLDFPGNDTPYTLSGSPVTDQVEITVESTGSN
ncbi:fasciclin domain-containing protein [Salinibacter altiplanensis]|uniref:fasciclin domain-containing protein n=1 Tax=Salinibacter altiplanensis TaxID=1803181 RepID=UPI000C9FF0A1|nr:fasciclin domain-containing protein [Salinibacter altiplanensis]